MTQHTPGPWTARLVPHPDEELAVHGIQGYRVTAPDGTILADMLPRPYRVAVSAENAHLVSAAPDLLDAVSSFWDWYASCDHGFPDEALLNVAVKKARAALAKAKGGAA